MTPSLAKMRMLRFHCPDPQTVLSKPFSRVPLHILPVLRPYVVHRGIAPLSSAAPQSVDGSPEQAELKSVETLPSGRTVQKLVSTAGLRPKRSVTDLPEVRINTGK